MAVPRSSPSRSCSARWKPAKDAWRYGGRGDRCCGPADLLQFLQANGYELSDVEKIVTGELDSEAVITRLTQQV